MIGYFFKGEPKGLTVMFIPSNLAVYEKKNKLGISFDANFLEELNLQFIRDKQEGNLERELKSGKTQLIDIEERFLRDFQSLISTAQNKEAHKKALELYEFVKSINPC
jgi:hypothetical protein